jgi:hypothetical protein
MPKITGEASKYAQNPTRIFQKCKKSHDRLQIMHNYVYLRVPRRIVYILEIPPGILYIIRSQSWDFVHFQKIIMGLCALFEVNHGILCIRGTSKNAQNHRRSFQICTKSYEDLPKMQKIP